MGQCTSTIRSVHGPPSTKRRTSFLGRRKKSKLGISHAFNLVEQTDATVELMDVNTASEEALMTLPGITRSTATSIVQYRNAIGGFRRVEDLAVVSGVGAEKLRLMMPEITTRNLSRTSSGTGTPSVDSLPSSDAQIDPAPRIISINNCNIFQLMNSTKINQETAANILHYRDKKGPFKYVDELVKVKGVNRKTLSNMKQWLVTEPIEMSNRDSVLTARSVTPRPNRNPYNIKRRALSVPTRRSNGLSERKGEINAAELYETLSLRCERPSLQEVFLDMRHGQPAWRVASWNLQQFTTDKAENLGVQEVFCRTVLENGIALTAVQEIDSPKALDKICQEMNYPQLGRVKDWEGPLGDWKCVVPQFKLGFVYDHSRGISLKEILSISSGNAGVVVAIFKVDEVEVCIMNCQVQRLEMIGCLIEEVKQKLKQNLPLILLGDFSVPPSNVVFDEFRSSGLTSLIPASVPTYSSPEPAAKGYWDNVWINADAKRIYTHEYSVVRGGLSHPCIPRGWNWGGPLSQHCPVWAEFYSTPNPRPMANGS